MATFKTRLSQISKSNGKVILANDYDSSEKNLQNKTIQNIKKLNPYLCGIKLNFHLLLPLSSKEIIKINKTAHDYGLQTIADIKLNDIGNTNRVTTEHLWNLGFIKDKTKGKYKEIEDKISDALAFMEACGITSDLIIDYTL